MMRTARFFYVGLLLGLSHHVGSPHALGAPGIGLGVEGHLLALDELLVAVGHDGGEVDEHVLAAVVGGDEAVALLNSRALRVILISS